MININFLDKGHYIRSREMFHFLLSLLMNFGTMFLDAILTDKSASKINFQ